jgi:hypothetical protein
MNALVGDPPEDSEASSRAGQKANGHVGRIGGEAPRLDAIKEIGYRPASGNGIHR